jgi:hypothetical protein
MNEDQTQRLPPDQDHTLGQILSVLQGLSGRVESLEQKVDARLYDTRPIWEKVQADISQLQEGQHRLEDGQRRFEERLEALHDDMRAGFRNLKRQFSILHETFLEARADYQDLDRRLYRIEEERNPG